MEWKPFKHALTSEEVTTLETSLVEWKQDEIPLLAGLRSPLETSLVEWKHSSWKIQGSGRTFLGNFLSGMETIEVGNIGELGEVPWKLP